MQFQLDQSIEVLASTPSVLDAFLRGKSEEWLHCRKSPEAFSPIDVVGHLMLADETDWLPRARLILEGNARTPFAPFDRFDFQRLIAGKSIDSLLDDFATLRAQSLQTLTALNLTEAQLDLAGPILNSARSPCATCSPPGSFTISTISSRSSKPCPTSTARRLARGKPI